MASIPIWKKFCIGEIFNPEVLGVGIVEAAAVEAAQAESDLADLFPND